MEVMGPLWKSRVGKLYRVLFVLLLHHTSPVGSQPVLVLLCNISIYEKALAAEMLSVLL